MDREKLKKLLDAKPVKITDQMSFAQKGLAKRVNEQQELILYLAQCLSTQAASIIDIRRMQGAQAGGIEALADIVGAETEDKSMIVMPETKLVGFDQ